ncbi:hypothetical protein BJ742DRAFT_790430 [Cladochytrium replicatum]|nr:hypothetical protein BJ742DRAFT_790430 [Cladochytrium replicatum]
MASAPDRKSTYSIVSTVPTSLASSLVDGDELDTLPQKAALKTRLEQFTEHQYSEFRLLESQNENENPVKARSPSPYGEPSVFTIPRKPSPITTNRELDRVTSITNPGGSNTSSPRGSPRWATARSPSGTSVASSPPSSPPSTVVMSTRTMGRPGVNIAATSMFVPGGSPAGRTRGLDILREADDEIEELPETSRPSVTNFGASPTVPPSVAIMAVDIPTRRQKLMIDALSAGDEEMEEENELLDYPRQRVSMEVIEEEEDEEDYAPARPMFPLRGPTQTPTFTRHIHRAGSPAAHQVPGSPLSRYDTRPVSPGSRSLPRSPSPVARHLQVSPSGRRYQRTPSPTFQQYTSFSDPRQLHNPSWSSMQYEVNPFSEDLLEEDEDAEVDAFPNENDYPHDNVQPYTSGPVAVPIPVAELRVPYSRSFGGESYGERNCRSLKFFVSVIFHFEVSSFRATGNYGSSYGPSVSSIDIDAALPMKASGEEERPAVWWPNTGVSVGQIERLNHITEEEEEESADLELHGNATPAAFAHHPHMYSAPHGPQPDVGTEYSEDLMSEQEHAETGSFDSRRISALPPRPNVGYYRGHSSEYYDEDGSNIVPDEPAEYYDDDQAYSYDGENILKDERSVLQVAVDEQRDLATTQEDTRSVGRSSYATHGSDEEEEQEQLVIQQLHASLRPPAHYTPPMPARLDTYSNAFAPRQKRPGNPLIHAKLATQANASPQMQHSGFPFFSNLFSDTRSTVSSRVTVESGDVPPTAALQQAITSVAKISEPLPPTVPMPPQPTQPSLNRPKRQYFLDTGSQDKGLKLIGTEQRDFSRRESPDLDPTLIGTPAPAEPQSWFSKVFTSIATSLSDWWNGRESTNDKLSEPDAPTPSTLVNGTPTLERRFVEHAAAANARPRTPLGDNWNGGASQGVAVQPVLGRAAHVPAFCAECSGTQYTKDGRACMACAGVPVTLYIMNEDAGGRMSVDSVGGGWGTVERPQVAKAKQSSSASWSGWKWKIKASENTKQTESKLNSWWKRRTLSRSTGPDSDTGHASPVLPSMETYGLGRVSPAVGFRGSFDGGERGYVTGGGVDLRKRLFNLLKFNKTGESATPRNEGKANVVDTNTNETAEADFHGQEGSDVGSENGNGSVESLPVSHVPAPVMSTEVEQSRREWRRNDDSINNFRRAQYDRFLRRSRGAQTPSSPLRVVSTANDADNDEEEFTQRNVLLQRGATGSGRSVDEEDNHGDDEGDGSVVYQRNNTFEPSWMSTTSSEFVDPALRSLYNDLVSGEIPLDQLAKKHMGFGTTTGSEPRRYHRSRRGVKKPSPLAQRANDHPLVGLSTSASSNDASGSGSFGTSGGLGDVNPAEFEVEQRWSTSTTRVMAWVAANSIEA